MYIRGKKCIGYLLVERLEQAFAVLNPAAAPSADPATRAETNKQESEHQPIKKISALAALRARKERLAQDLLTSAAQPIQLADVESPAVLGITRIWTSFTHRGQNIAPTLLDAAVKYHNDFVAHAREPVPQLENVPAETHAVLFPPYEKPAIVRREQVAFSQPTEAGARLARRWVGKAYGWLVYV
jgi:N-acetyltransferase